MIENADMPLVLAGNGVIRGNASKELKEFILKTQIGTTTTFMGMGAMPADNDLFISTVGLQSKDYISCGFNRADLIITVGYDPVEFSPIHWNTNSDKNIIHINFTQ